MLKRVTFSGRLGTPKNGDETKRIVLKGLVYMTLDIVITLAVSIALFYFFVKTAVSPYPSDFHCSDVDIQKPFKPNTVGMKHLLLVSLGSPFFIIFIVEALLFKHSKGEDRLAKFFTTTTIIYMKYLLLFALCTFTMEFLKCYFGRLRPHFVSVCDPDWTKMDCKTDPNAIIPAAETYCLNPNEHRVRTARTSFPSGHTAAAVLAFLFYTIYLTRMARVTRIPQIAQVRNIAMLIITPWTIFTGISRITDCWHHPTDVLGGIALALVSIVPFLWSSWSSTEKVYGPRKIAPLKDE